jgi:hypothetical protein
MVLDVGGDDGDAESVIGLVIIGFGRDNPSSIRLLLRDKHQGCRMEYGADD